MLFYKCVCREGAEQISAFVAPRDELGNPEKTQTNNVVIQASENTMLAKDEYLQLLYFVLFFNGQI